MDAVNIDLKGFTHDYYRKVCGGDLDAVLETIEGGQRVVGVGRN